MGTKVAAPPGNILGSARAENDQVMLEAAFVKTAEFRALTSTRDFHFVVGRRGTGKSALFAKLQQELRSRRNLFVIVEQMPEHAFFSISGALNESAPKYSHARAIARALLRVAIARSVFFQLRTRRPDLAAAEPESDLFPRDERSLRSGVFAHAAALLRACAGQKMERFLPELVSLAEDLEGALVERLPEASLQVVVLIDRLDEGWEPNLMPTAILGGLGAAATDFAERQIDLHVVAFVRDNMFRALAHYDPDFSRNIEDVSLRLRWDQDSLFDLVVERIRVAFKLEVENNIKVWNRFAQRDLADRAGFLECLKHTLYRPRDVVTLLNHAYLNASKGHRTSIIGDDVASAARAISETRLEDLVKEYDAVLPGVRDFVKLFANGPTQMSYREALDVLEASTDHILPPAATHSSALLGSSSEVFLALFSVGYFGIQKTLSGFEFCHDGAPLELSEIDSSTRVAIHPCFWRALDLQGDGIGIDVLVKINDEYTGPVGSVVHVKDHRMRQLGQIVEDYHKILPGQEAAPKFEEWVLRVVKVLFAGDLSNAALHPNGAAAQRRDVIATNDDGSKFWSRILTDYGARQVVFEVKNYADISPEDYNQAISYCGNQYGKLIFIVYRPAGEGLDENQRSHIKSRYDQSRNLIVLLPAKLLARCLSKHRAKPGKKYTEQHLGKLLDTYERNYLSTPSGRKAKLR
jgi:hypothetical protein